MVAATSFRRSKMKIIDFLLRRKPIDFKVTVQRVQCTRSSHTFACVATAYANALDVIGVASHGADAQLWHVGGDKREHWREEGRWATKLAKPIRKWGKSRGLNLVIQPIIAHKNLEINVRVLRRLGFKAAVVGIPGHAFALDLRGDTPVIIDNGAWKGHENDLRKMHGEDGIVGVGLKGPQSKSVQVRRMVQSALWVVRLPFTWLERLHPMFK